MNVGKAYENFIRSRRQKGCLDKTLNSYKNLIAGFIKFAGSRKRNGRYFTGIIRRLHRFLICP